MRVALLVVLTVLCIPCALAAPCGPVLDNQHLFSTSQSSDIADTAKQVNGSTDANVNVLTADVPSNGSMEDLVNGLVSSCDNWHNDQGTRASNLVVLALDSNHRKMGIFFGGQWHAALDSRWHNIESTYMAPHFRDKEWAAGMLEGVRQVGAVLMIDHTAGAANPGSVTLKQSTDLRPLWWLGLALLGIGLLLLLWLALRAVWRSRRATREAEAAAVDARNQASSALDGIRTWLQIQTAAGTAPTYAQDSLDQAFIDFKQINDSYDITTLSIAKAAKIKYDMLTERVRNIRRSSVVDSSVSSASTKRRRGDRSRRSTTYVPPAPTPVYNPAPPVTTVNVERDSGLGDLLTGMVLGEALSNDRSERDDDEPVRHYHRRYSDDSSSSSSSRSDDSGSSSWGSGGGSSSWGSGDGGGGGSTDFGGGSSDSGGGGSDSFS